MPPAARRATALLRWAWTLSALAPTPRSRARLFAVALLMPVKRRVPSLRSRQIRVELASAGAFWFSDRSELRALEEVFVLGEYDVPLPSEPEVIVDLGANAGQASLFFRARYPDARIIAVEPDPSTFRHLERNLGADANAVTRQVAVTAAPGEVRLRRFPDASWMTQVTTAGADDGGTVAVPGVTLDDVLTQEGVDRVGLLKVDIEGLEIDVLTSGAALRRADTVIGELHYWLHDVDREATLRRFQRHGEFDDARFVDHHLFLLTRRPPA
jgi:FkbM family methyltransferase